VDVRLKNETSLVTGWTMALRPDGRELLVVVAKGTYVLVDREAREREPRLADTQMALLMADEFGEDPAKTATRFENDFAPSKPECDVLLVGAAHAPQGRPVRSLGVGLRVGSISKTFNVTGPRRWRQGLIGSAVPGEPEPMVTQPISYDFAFGGIETDPKNPERIDAFLENPVGRGFRKRHLDLAGQPMPVTEEISDPIRDPRKGYRPMALGPLGRSWQQRAQYAGTYNQKWIEEVAPMLPADFDQRYFQAAPADQRLPYPSGGEPVRLVNLVPISISPDASAQTSIPQLPVAVVFVSVRGVPLWVDANLDTVVIEPEENRFTCAWRASYVATRDMFEIREMVVIVRSPEAEARLRARLSGKEHFTGLAALARSRKSGSR
jgi:hypothetical protein